MKSYELPLLELFTRLRQAGLPLGVNEYQLVLRALQSGFGIPNREALARLCCTLWVKSAEDKLLFNYHFEEVMAEDVKQVRAEDEAARLATEFSPVSPEPELPKNPIIALWRKISLPTRLALGGTLVLVTGIALWSVIPRKECPYFTSRPPQFIQNGKEYNYQIKVCKAHPTDRVEIKALQKHPSLTLKFNRNDDRTAILQGSKVEMDYVIVRLWDLRSKRSETKVFGNLRNIKNISLSPDGKYLVTKLNDDTAHLWDIKDKSRNIFGNLQIKDIRFSPDGKYLVTKLNDDTAHLWDIKGKSRNIFGNLQIKDISFSPDGKHLVTKLNDDTAHLWDIKGKSRNIFGNLQVKDISFSPDGKHLVTKLKDDTARLWDIKGKSPNIFGNLQIKDVRFSPDKQHLVTMLTDETARLWDIQGKQLTDFDNSAIKDVRFSPDKQHLVTMLTDDTARLWNIQGKQLQFPEFDDLKLPGFDHLMVKDIRFSHDGQHLTTVSESSEVILQVSDLATRKKKDTQTFNLISTNEISELWKMLTPLLIIFSIGISLGILVLPGGYVIARLITQRNAKPPKFPLIPQPDEETQTSISALNQDIRDEVQVAKAIHQGTRSDTDLPLSSFTESNEYFPVTSRQMKQSWRYLRRFIREGPPIELDVEATVNQMSRQGMLLYPVLKPRRVNRNELLLLVDQDGSMAPFHSLSERLAESAIQGGRLGKASIYYFHNCPSQHLYQDPYHQVAEPIGEVLAKLHAEYAGILIFSDAGAARGAFSRERLDLTAEFLDQLRQQLRHIAWLNPVPRDRWTGTAEEIAKIVPMFELSRQGLTQAIDVLRGKSTIDLLQKCHLIPPNPP
jgi:WD40 repeat protein/uncharacterized protein with von Willebrand factor type A (vWA) domain